MCMCAKLYLYIPAYEMAYILRSSWYEASKEENEAMAGAGGVTANAE